VSHNLSHLLSILLNANDSVVVTGVGAQNQSQSKYQISPVIVLRDRLCDLVVRVLGYRSRGPG
jgi:hypothetical protein